MLDFNFLQLANLMVEAENARQEVLGAAFNLLDDQVLCQLVCDVF